MTHLRVSITVLDLNCSFTVMNTINLKIVVCIFALGYYGHHSEQGKSLCAKPIAKTVNFVQEKHFF